jgi:hypothetical protein
MYDTANNQYKKKNEIGIISYEKNVYNELIKMKVQKSDKHVTSLTATLAVFGKQID